MSWRRLHHLTAGLALCALAWLVFGRILSGQAVYYGGDAARQYIPQQVALGRALANGQLPWWAPELGLGYPLLAEGQTAALYPLTLLLHALLPALWVSSASVVLHCVLTALGMFLLARERGLAAGASLLGALSWALGGFAYAHLSHPGIVATIAWLPWLMLLGGRVLTAERRARWLWGAALAVATGCYLLAGHAQMALLGLPVLAAHAAIAVRRAGPRERGRGVAAWIVALLLGGLLAGPQLLAGLELAGLSQRAGGLEGELFTTFSFHPLLVATLVSPYLLGNPYPHGSVELMAYMGLLPLMLAAVALAGARRREAWFWAGLAMAGLLLALGRYNPLYKLLERVPLLNLFRVPARYLMWTSLGLSMLCAHGADHLARRMRGPSRLASWGALAALACLGWAGALWARGALDVEAWVALWRWLPLAWAMLAGALLLSARWLAARDWLLLACAVLALDLYAHAVVLDGTFNLQVPAERVAAPPDSLALFADDGGLYRLFTREEIVPAPSVQRESHYPNMALQHGLHSANLYLPLVPRAYERYMASLDAQRLDRMNVRYYLIPQLLPIDAASELYDVFNPFAALPSNVWLEVPPLELATLQIESYLSHAAHLEDGALAGELWLRDVAGEVTVVPLRAGIETAEWAYQRDDVAGQVRHAQPAVARSFPARSGFPPRDHEGQTYLVEARLSPPVALRAVRWRPALPEAHVRLESVLLGDPAGRERLLAHMVGLGDHRLVYRSEDVLVYRNEDAWPRAYLVPEAAVEVLDDQVALASQLTRHDLGPVQMLRYEPMEVEVAVVAPAPAYLVLADLAYPGWEVYVNGEARAGLVVDGTFRAVWLDAGEHTVRWVYRPLSTLLLPSR